MITFLSPQMIKRKYEGEYTTAMGCFNDGIVRHYSVYEGQQVDQWEYNTNGWQFIFPGLDPVPHWYQFWTYVTVVQATTIEGVREVSHITLNCVELDDLEGIAFELVVVPEGYEPQVPFVPMHTEGVPSQYEIMPPAGMTHMIAQGMFDLEGSHVYEIDALVQLTKADSIVVVFFTPIRGVGMDQDTPAGTNVFAEYRMRPFQFHISYYVKYL